MTKLYPLRFQPLWRHYLWGGRRLESSLGKPIPPDRPCAESWELVDHGDDQSRVVHGPLAGASLGALVRDRGRELLGRHAGATQFPLLLKFLDARQPLSLQVHPNDRQAALLTPPDLGKTEAWVIVEADPGSYLYAGLKVGCDRAALEQAVARGECEQCLARIEPAVGDCIFIPAGTPHALGPGLLVAEIQQSSDTTYRLFDWNRLGPDGKPRALHAAQAVETIDYSRGPVAPVAPSGGNGARVERLVECDKFVLTRRWLDSSTDVGGDDRAHILVVLAGAVDVAGDDSGQLLGRGQVALVPAACGATTITPHGPATLLDIYLP